MLKLNANKCKTVSYGRNVSTDYIYYLNGTVLARDNFIKDLGVIFDDQLNFQRHCYEKINKAYSMLGIIKSPPPLTLTTALSHSTRQEELKTYFNGQY